MFIKQANEKLFPYCVSGHAGSRIDTMRRSTCHHDGPIHQARIGTNYWFSMPTMILTNKSLLFIDLFQTKKMNSNGFSRSNQEK
ncbi:hypothetical protein Hanom_Chr13g01235111 [Helianthus anomalus]